MPDSPLVGHVKRSLYRLILRHLEINNRRQSQHMLAEKLGLHQPDVSRLLAGKLDRFNVELLLRVVERLGAEFCFDSNADAQAVRAYKDLLARCRKAKNGSEMQTINSCLPSLRAMDSPIVALLKHRRELDELLRYINTQRNTPRDDLEWLMGELESQIAELARYTQTAQNHNIVRNFKPSNPGLGCHARPDRVKPLCPHVST
jgi:predicted XRE-type DNA-binding protein